MGLAVRFFNRKQLLWFIVTVAILAVTIYLADINKLWSALSEARLEYVVLCLIFGSSILVFRSRVWHGIFRHLEFGISKRQSFLLFSAGEFLNNVTPLGQAGGQPFMAYIISDNTDIDYERSLATVVSADVLAGLPFLTFAIGAGSLLFIQGIEKTVIGRVAVYSLGAITVLSLLVYLLWFRSGFLEGYLLRGLDRILWKDRWMDAIETRVERAEDTFQMIGEDPRGLILPGIYAHLAFFMDVLVLYLGLLSLGVSVNPGYLLLVFPLANLSKSAPTSGGSGVYEFTLASMITLLAGISFHLAVAGALIYRLSTYWVAITVGSISLSRLNYSSLQQT